MTNRISNLPDAPLASDNQTIFNNKAFPFVAALQPFVDEVNAVVGEINTLHNSTVSASQNATAKSSEAASSATFAETKALEAEVYAELLKSYTVGSSQVRVGSVVGSMRNGRVDVPTSNGTTMTFYADELVVCSTLGGLSYKISSVSATIDISVNSIGGINVGPNVNNGFAAIYAIYNPTSGSVMLTGVDCTDSTQSEIYPRAMPVGYSASALVSIVRISGRKLTAFRQRDRTVNYSVQLPGYQLMITKDSAIKDPVVTFDLDVPYGIKEAICTAHLQAACYSQINYSVYIAHHGLLGLSVTKMSPVTFELIYDSSMFYITPIYGRKLSIVTTTAGVTGDTVVSFSIYEAGYKF